MRPILLFAVLLVGCAELEPPNKVAPASSIKPAACLCSADVINEGICLTGPDTDSDCVCDFEDNCMGASNCDRENADGDAFGDVCDIMPNTADPEAVLTALDARLDTLEAAGTGAAITALQADVALLTAALVEVRSKYPAHFHGLLGLNGDPVGSSGDLSYSLPGDP